MTFAARPLSIAVLAAAVLAAVVPLPATLVEAWYSRGLYARLQPLLTRFSSVLPIAFLDLASIALLALLIVYTIRRWRRSGVLSALKGAAWRLAVSVAAIYLWFLLCWGFNYRRVTLENRLDYADANVTPESALVFARETVQQVNALAGVPRQPTAPGDLRASFVHTQQALQDAFSARLPEPKRSMLNLYFRVSGVDGMTVPWFLEVILLPEVLPVERPYMLAHEWAHLAGYAHESDASFVSWLACVGSADPMARYSGWLAAYRHAVLAVPRDERRALRSALHPAASADLAAIYERQRRANPVVSRAAMRAYDSYLRANRVEEGIASYDAVLRLMVGARFDSGWRVRLKTAGPSGSPPR